MSKGKRKNEEDKPETLSGEAGQQAQEAEPNEKAESGFDKIIRRVAAFVGLSAILVGGIWTVATAYLGLSSALEEARKTQGELKAAVGRLEAAASEIDRLRESCDKLSCIVLEIDRQQFAMDCEANGGTIDFSSLICQGGGKSNAFRPLVQVDPAKCSSLGFDR